MITAREKMGIAILAIAIGASTYVTSAVWSAIFIVALPQEPDWCIEARRIQVAEDEYEERCVEFKNEMAHLKHLNNLEMLERNKYWVYSSLLLGALLGGTVLAIWSGVKANHSVFDSAMLGGLVGLCSALVGPFIYTWLLPPPINWFPQELNRISREREAAAIERLEFNIGFNEYTSDQVDKGKMEAGGLSDRGQKLRDLLKKKKANP